MHHPEEIFLSPLSYEASLAVCESDHKPIALTLDITAPGFDQDLKRKVSFEALSRGLRGDPSIFHHPTVVVTREGQEMTSLPNLGPVPHLRIASAPSRLLITNTSNVPAAVTIGHYGPDYSSDKLKLPSWLDVNPSSFFLEGQGIKEVWIRASHADIIYAQQYPLEATIVVMAQNAVVGAGMGGWRQGKEDRSAAAATVLVIDAHPGS